MISIKFMKYHSQDLLTLLISLFIFSSCSNPSLVGLDINENDQIQGRYTDTVTIHASTFRAEESITSGSTVTPFGYLKDPTIGETSSSFAFALAPRTSGDSRLPAGITIDSAVLTLNYSNHFFGDTTTGSTYHIEVNQLQEPYKFNSPYTSAEVWKKETAIVGSKSINKFAYKDSILVDKRVDGKDTVIRIAPQLRIPMDGAMLKSLFDHNLDSATFADQNKFHERVKGFYVSINQASQVGKGGIINLSLSNEVNGIEIYYKLPDSTSQSTRRYPLSHAQSASAITHSFTNDVEAQLNSSAEDQSTIYVQGLSGLNSKISFPYLDYLKDQGIIVNKAELVMYVDQAATGSDFTQQAPRLTLYRKDIAGKFTPIPDGDTRTSNRGQPSEPRSFGVAYGGFYEKDKKRYVFTLTSFVQDILLGKTKNKEIYLTTANERDLAQVPYAPDFRIGSRAVLGGGSNANYKMKLNLYTSKISD